MGRAGRDRTGRAPAVARALAALALVGVLAACGSSGSSGGVSSSPAQAAVVVPDADCLAPEVLAALGMSLDPSLAATGAHATAPAPGAVPADFDPAGVLVCQAGGRMLDGAGRWTAVTETTREGSADELVTLLAALTEPVDAGASCDAGAAPMVLWLVDPIGQAVRPTVPLDGCGVPGPAVLGALAQLPVTGVVDHQVELVTASPDAS